MPSDVLSVMSHFFIIGQLSAVQDVDMSLPSYLWLEGTYDPNPGTIGK